MLARGGPAGEDDDLADGGGDAGGGWEPWDAPGPGEAGGQAPGPAGFGSGQPFDVLRPGPVLAGAADRVHTGALRWVSDEELTGMIRAWRRLSSWATARELGAIAEFARRRPDEGPGPGMDGDVARRVRARRAASGPPGAAGQAGSAQAPPAGGVNPAAEAAQPGGASPAAEAGQPGGVNPAAQAGQPGGASPAAEAAQPGGVNPAARDATAAPAGGAGGATPAAPAPAAAPAGGASPAAAADACAGGRPGTGSGFPEVISAFASYELSLALTLTGRSAEAYLDFAVELATKLPKTMAALEAGQIDIIRARIIAEATHVLSNEHTAAVEDRIFPRAGQQTSGQLRAALARAVLAADPGAARARREEAQRDARVLRWREDAGTAALCGRDLPSADVLAADQRISARARDLRSAGVTGTLDELRARAYLDFLLGRDSMPPPPSGQPGTATAPGESPADGPPAGGPPAGNPPAGNPPAGNPPAGNPPAGNPPAGNPPAGGPAAGGSPAGNPPAGNPPAGGPAAGGSPAGNPPAGDPPAGDPPASEPPAAGMSPAAADGPGVPPRAGGGPAGSLAARINVTVPLAAILGLCDTPGEVAAFGPVDADVTRDLIRAAGLHPATRWCVTVVSPDGQAIGHGCAHGRHQPPAFSPDSGTDPPRTGSSPPGTGSSPPGTGSSPPGGGNSPPGTGGSAPGGGSSPPDGGNSPPGGGDGPPGGGDGPPGRGGGPGGNGTPGNGGGPGGDGPGHGGGPEGAGPGTSGGPPGTGGGPPGPRHRPGDTAPGPVSPPPALSSQARTFIQRLGVTITPLAAGTCDHRNQEPGYTLSPRLRHLIAARTVSCCAPGCRRPAARCDFDHTIAYQAGGRSCECNVRPLCRRHHRCKQAPGWALQQPDPGTMIWTTPAGRTYTTGPTIYHL